MTQRKSIAINKKEVMRNLNMLMFILFYLNNSCPFEVFIIILMELIIKINVIIKQNKYDINVSI